MKLQLKFVLIVGIFALVANCVTDEDKAPASSEKHKVEADKDSTPQTVKQVKQVKRKEVHSGDEGHDEDDEDTHEADDEDDSEDEEEVDYEAADDDEEDADGHVLTSAQVHALHKKMDANGNGKLSKAEVSHFATHMRRTMAAMELNDTMKTVDTNGDHEVSFQEYAGDPKATEEGEKEMAIEFRGLDTNGNKVLDVHELTMLFKHHTNEKVEDALTARALKDKDKNGDGMLSLEEFYSHLGTTDDDDDEEEEPKEDISQEDKEMFANLDLDKSGSLTMDELKAWESGAHEVEEAVKQIFASADKDKDNHLTADELAESREELRPLDDITELEHFVSEKHGEL